MPVGIKLIAHADAERYFVAKGTERERFSKHRVRTVHEGLFTSQYAISPNFLSWSDDGQEVLTACDHHGIRRFKVGVNSLTLEQDHYTSRLPHYWTPTPEWCRWSIHPHLGRSLCYFIKVSDLRLPGADLLFFQLSRDAPIPIGLNESGLHVGGLDAIGNADRMPNPWRPGHQEILVMDSGGRARLNGGARAISIISVPEVLAATSISAGLTRRYELDSIVPPGHYVQSYSWHYSGQFMAVEVGSRSQIELRRVWIIEYNEGRILAVSPRGRSMVGWIGLSNRLLLMHTCNNNQSATDNYSEWNILMDQEQEIDLQSPDPVTDRLLQAHRVQRRGYSRSQELNSNGSLWLNADNNCFRVSAASEVVNGGIVEIDHCGVAAWSPTDPSLIASAGEIDGEVAVRLWRIEMRRDIAL